MTVTIYHNPNCGTSRDALAMIKRSGVEPQVIEYLETPPSAEKIKMLLTAMKIGARDLLRRNEAIYDEMSLGNTELSEDHLIDAMVAHPVLFNRPVVVASRGARLCRPAETVLEILDNPNIGPFQKETGQTVNGPLV